MNTSRWLALVLLVAELLHIATKVQIGDPIVEFLWWCHLCAATTIVGLALGQRHLLAAGAIFYVGLGLPLWLIEAFITGTTVTSAFVHVLTPAFALVGMRGLAWPRFIWLWTALAMWPPLLIARFFTDPALNINVSHGMWFNGDPRPLWLGWLTNYALVLGVCFATQRAFEWLFRRLERAK